MRLTEVPGFIAVPDAWGGTLHVRPEAVQAIGAAHKGEHAEAPAVKHPTEPWRVVTLAGGGHVYIAANDTALTAALGL